MNGIPITVIIPVRNEALNLPLCLAALEGRFDEVIVVDSSSSDATPSIAAEQDVRLVNFEWNGRYPKKRNWFLDNHETRHDWCLFLDADEVVTPAFITEIAGAIERNDKAGFWLNYTNYFLGRPLRHGISQRKLALFRKSAGRYERIEEERYSALDMEVHEHPQLDGKVGEIKARIDHRDFHGIGKFIERHLEYARWEAKRHAALKGTPAFDRLTKRQKTKYRHLARPWFALAYFLGAYVAKCGFLDGTAGLQYALYKAWYFNTIRVMIRQQACIKSQSGGYVRK